MPPPTLTLILMAPPLPDPSSYLISVHPPLALVPTRQASHDGSQRALQGQTSVFFFLHPTTNLQGRHLTPPEPAPAPITRIAQVIFTTPSETPALLIVGGITLLSIVQSLPSYWFGLVFEHRGLFFVLFFRGFPFSDSAVRSRLRDNHIFTACGEEATDTTARATV